MRNLYWYAGTFLIFNVAFAALAQTTPVAAPPRPSDASPANAEILKLLQAGLPEGIVLSKIRTIGEKFDTSADALVALKKAGATDAELTAIVAPAGSVQPLDAATVANGPPLAATMQFIQDQLNGLGDITFRITFYTEFDQDDSDYLNETDQVASVRADPSQCRITYHVRLDQIEGNGVLSLRGVKNILVEQLDKKMTDYWRKGTWGDSMSVMVQPLTWDLVVVEPGGIYPPISTMASWGDTPPSHVFRFQDADLADRVAKALTHAVELCGGGAKPESF